jgi:hypothetical protein
MRLHRFQVIVVARSRFDVKLTYHAAADMQAASAFIASRDDVRSRAYKTNHQHEPYHLTLHILSSLQGNPHSPDSAPLHFRHVSDIYFVSCTVVYICPLLTQFVTALTLITLT